MFCSAYIIFRDVNHDVVRNFLLNAVFNKDAAFGLNR